MLQPVPETALDVHTSASAKEKGKFMMTINPEGQKAAALGIKTNIDIQVRVIVPCPRCLRGACPLQQIGSLGRLVHFVVQEHY